MISVLLACTRQEEGEYKSYLEKAQQLVEAHPDSSLLWLHAIPNPQAMDKELYMEYIVTDLQARRRAGQDVTADTLIYRAIRYFETTGNHPQAARACYYGALVSRDNGKPEPALELFRRSERYALRCHDYLLAGKAEKNIGDLYYEQDDFDSAINNYKKTIHHYNKVGENNAYMMDVLNLAGCSYLIIGQPDTAYILFEKLLVIANRIPDEKYQFHTTNNIGLCLRESGKLKEAEQYFTKALTLTQDSVELFRIHVNMAGLYLKAGNGKTTSKYVNYMIEHLEIASDHEYLLYETYNTLKAYSREAADLPRLMNYLDLLLSVNEKIQERTQRNILLLQDAELKVQKQFQAAEKKHREGIINLVLLFIIILLVAYLLFIQYKKRKEKAAQARVEAEKANTAAEKAKNQSMQYTLNYIKSENRAGKRDIAFSLLQLKKYITDNWHAIDDEIQQLTSHFNADDKPGLVRDMEALFGNSSRELQEMIRSLTYEYIENERFGHKLSAAGENVFTYRDCLVIMLIHRGLTRSEIAELIDTPGEQTNFDALAAKLRKHRFGRRLINLLTAESGK